MTLAEAEEIAEKDSGWPADLSAELTRTYKKCNCSACFWRRWRIRNLLG